MNVDPDPSPATAPTITERLRRDGVDVTLDLPARATPRPGAPGPEASAARGRRLGRYAVLGPLGEGGMGEILLVLDPDLGRTLAAKVLHPTTEDRRERLLRFVRESKISGQLEHPNILPIHELGMTADGTPFFTMKRVEGEDLSGLIAREAARIDAAAEPAEAYLAALPRLISILLKVCDGVAFAHARGVIHRDLKPANVMVGAYGEVMVMDWGLAKVVGGADPGQSAVQATLAGSLRRLAAPSEGGDEPPLTRAGTILGTPAYMSPEQAFGEIEEADARSDVYALGAILYELLTFTPPYLGDHPRDLLQQVRAGPPALPQSRTALPIPWELTTVVTQAMGRTPQQRYPTVADLRDELERWQLGGRLSTVRYSVGQLLVRWLRRHRAVVVGLAAVLLTAAGLGTVALVSLVRAWRAELAARQSAEAGRGRAERASRQAELAREAEALARRRADASLAASRRQLAHGLLFKVGAAVAQQRLLEAQAYLAQARWLASSRRLDAAAWMLPPAPVELARILAVQPGRAINALAWAADGQRLAVAGDGGGVSVWDARQGTRRVTLAGHRRAVTSVAITPAGAWLASAASDGEVRLWHVASGAHRVLVSGRRDAHTPPRSLAFSADGARLAIGVGDAVQILDVGRAQVVQQLRTPVDCCLFERVGTTLLVAANGQVSRWDVVTGRVLERLARPDPDPIVALGLTPGDDRVLALEGEHAMQYDPEARDWYMLHNGPLAGACRAVSASTAEAAPFVLVARETEPACLIDARAEVVLTQLLPQGAAAQAVAVTPGGGWLATGDREGLVRLWRVTPTGTGGQALEEAPSASAPIRGAPIALSADGRWAAFGAPGRVDVHWLARRRRVRLAHPGERPMALWLAGGGRLACGTEEGTLWLWPDLAGRPRRVPTDAGPIRAVARARDGRVATGHDNGTVAVWRADGTPLARWVSGAARPIRALAWRPDGVRLACAGDETVIRVHDPRDGALRVRLGGHRGPVGALAYAPGGRRLASGSTRGRIRVWQPRQPQQGAQVLRCHIEAIRCLGWAAGDVLVSAGADRTIAVWNALEGRLLHSRRHEGIPAAVHLDPSAGVARVLFRGGALVRLGGVDLARERVSARTGLRLDGSDLVPLKDR